MAVLRLGRFRAAPAGTGKCSPVTPLRAPRSRMPFPAHRHAAGKAADRRGTGVALDSPGRGFPSSTRSGREGAPRERRHPAM
jgi:hypothetical protein